jgi:hypothetical protein
LNPFEIEIAGRLQFYRSDGSPWPIRLDRGPQNEREYRIAPHGLAHWTSEGSPGQVEAGYSLLTPSSGPAPAASAVIHFAPEGLMSQTGVPYLPMAESGFTYWEADAETYTGAAFANASAEARRIGLSLHVRGGIERVLQAEIGLAPGRHVARLLTELFPDLPSSSRGVLLYESDGPVGFLSLRLRGTPRGDTLTSSLVLGDLPGGSVRLLPQVVSGGGYVTRIVLANAGRITAEGRMIFRDSNGSPDPLLLVTR